MVDKAALEGLRIQRADEDRPRRSPWLIILPIALLILAGIAWALTRGSGKEVRVAPAKAVTAGQSAGAVLNATGYVTARRQATVSSKVTGKVIEVFIEEGMRVKAGQVLARLDALYVARGLALSQAEAQAARSADRKSTRLNS